MYVYHLLYTSYGLPIGCQLVALDAHNGCVPPTEAQGAGSLWSRPTAPWALVVGPGPIPIIA